MPRRQILLAALLAPVGAYWAGGPLVDRRVISRSPPVCAKLSRKARQQQERQTAGLPAGLPGEEDPVAAPMTAATNGADASVPVASSEPAVCGELIFPLPDEQWEAVRVAAPAPFEAVYQAAAAASTDEEAMARFVVVNRDLIDYRFMYKLTAQLLAATNLGDEKAAEEKREVRVQLMRGSTRFDASLFKEITPAETRLGQVLAQFVAKSPPSASGVVAAAGSNAAQMFAFWLVVVAAMAAWESKEGQASIADMVSAKLAELTAVRDALESSHDFLERSGVGGAAELLHLPDQWRFGADPAAAAEKLVAVAAGEEERTRLIRRLGCIHCQLSRHALQAYRPSVVKFSGIYDVLLKGSPQYLTAENTFGQPREAPFKSQLVQMEHEAEGITENRDVTLNW